MQIFKNSKNDFKHIIYKNISKKNKLDEFIKLIGKTYRFGVSYDDIDIQYFSELGLIYQYTHGHLHGQKNYKLTALGIELHQYLIEKGKI